MTNHEIKLTNHEIKLHFVQAILDSVTEHGRATTSLMGANRAYDAIKKAGLLIQGDYENVVKSKPGQLIALLESMRCEGNGVSHDCADSIGHTTVDDLIALIKGDNK